MPPDQNASQILSILLFSSPVITRVAYSRARFGLLDGAMTRKLKNAEWRAVAGTPRRNPATARHSASYNVELAGIEPASFDAEPGLLRVQSASRFSQPRRSRRHATDRLSRCKSPDDVPRPDVISKPPK